MSSKLQPAYDQPYISYTMRILAWQSAIAKSTSRITDDDITNAVRRTLRELGNIPVGNATVYKYTNEVRSLLNEIDYSPKQWKGDEWYLLYAPFHRFVRELASKPVVHGPDQNAFNIIFRDPAVPSLKFVVGNSFPGDEIFDKANPRMIYFLRHTDEDNEEALYIGITDDSDSRMRNHFKSKNPHWWFIAQQSEHYNFNATIQETTENMLIAFWNEIANVSNGKWGKDTTPNFTDLQQTTLLTSAISAAYLWLVREQRDKDEIFERLQLGKKQKWDIPFKSWPKSGFADRYPKLEEIG